MKRRDSDLGETAGPARVPGQVSKLKIHPVGDGYVVERPETGHVHHLNQTAAVGVAVARDHHVDAAARRGSGTRGEGERLAVPREEARGQFADHRRRLLLDAAVLSRVRPRVAPVGVEEGGNVVDLVARRESNP